MRRKPNIRPIGKAEIKRILTSEEFKERLTVAADITWNANHESAFYIFRDIYENRIFFGDVVGPDTRYSCIQDGMSEINMVFFRSIDPLLSQYGMSAEYNEAYPVILLHLHTFPSSFDPSEEDIQTWLSFREQYYYAEALIGEALINCRPIEIIGSIPDIRGIELLLLQETCDKPLGEHYAGALISSIRGNPEYKDDNETIARLYNDQMDLQADMVVYERMGAILKLRMGDYRKLSRFSSTPKFFRFSD